jgi:aminopeptidase
MEQKLLQDYARLIAQVGGHVGKGEEVWIYASLDEPEFTYMVVEECYKAGAKKVEVIFDYDQLAKLHYKYMTLGNLSKISPMGMARQKYRAKKLPTTIYLMAEDPDGLKGINQTKMAKSRAKIYQKIKKYRDLADGKYKWCIAGVPCKPWAKKVFPDLEENEAVEKLWEAILMTSRVDGNDPVENWNKHNDFMVGQRNKLNAMDLRKLYYKASNGTDFEVELIPGVSWGAGIEEAPKKGVFNPNIPTEEVFTSPLRGRCEGTLVASKPLSYNGELIEDFSITFKDGKVSSVKARKNQKLLETMVGMDEGASMLGEVALVPYTSPINMSGILFYNTLYDENACCHVALGVGFKELLDVNLTTEEAKEKGINDSMIHVDFMVGTKDLNIIGEDAKGVKHQIFKDGEWAI